MAIENAFERMARVKSQNNRDKLRPEHGITYVTPETDTNPMKANTENNMVGARDYINQKYSPMYGLKDSDIGWNNGMVTVKGIDAFKPDKLENGRSFVNPNLIDSTMERMATQGNWSKQAPITDTTKPQIPLTPQATPNATMQPPQYQGINIEKMNALTDKILGMQTPSEHMKAWDFNSDPRFQALKGQYEKQGQSAFNNAVGAMSAMTGGRLNSWASSAASQAQNAYNNQLMGLVPQMYQNELDSYNKDYERNLGNLDLLNKQDTNAYERFNKEQDRGIDSFGKSIAGLGDQYDYQKAINDYKNDGDPSNDWKIPLLMQQRQVKLDNNVKDFASTATQYYNDYQDAINKLDKTDPLYSKKLGILNMARNEKLVKMEQQKKEDEANKEKIRQFNVNFDEQVRNRMSNDALQRQQIGVSQGNLDLNKQIRQDSLTEKKDQTSYENIYKSFTNQYGNVKYDDEGNKVGFEFPEQNKAIMRNSLLEMTNNKNISPELARMLASNLGL